MKTLQCAVGCNGVLYEVAQATNREFMAVSMTDKKRRIDIFVDSLRECGLEFPCTIANSAWIGAYERGDISLADLHSCATFRPIDHDNKEFRLAAVQP